MFIGIILVIPPHSLHLPTSSWARAPGLSTSLGIPRIQTDSSTNPTLRAGMSSNFVPMNSPRLLAVCGHTVTSQTGSFCILDAPGHCTGHITALACVCLEPESFILMAGDSVHLGGELRHSLLTLFLDIVHADRYTYAAEELLKIHSRSSPTLPFTRLRSNFFTRSCDGATNDGVCASV